MSLSVRFIFYNSLENTKYERSKSFLLLFIKDFQLGVVIIIYIKEVIVVGHKVYKFSIDSNVSVLSIFFRTIRTRNAIIPWSVD